MKTYSRQRGVALVETAIVISLIITLTMGMIEYGWMFLKAQQINNAARHGVRQAILPDATEGEVKTSITLLLTEAKLTGEVTITGIDDAPGEPVKVVISSPYISLLNTSLLPVPDHLGASVTMAKEGP